jgi:carboxyl-terminal processing protease
MKKFSFILFVLTFFTISLFSPHITAQTVANEQPATADKKAAERDARNRRLETFEIVWQTINDNYFDRTFSGLNWNKIKAEYEPQAAAAASDAELHGVLQMMIARLNRSHFSIIPPEVFVAIEEAKQTAAAQGRELTEERSEEELSEDSDAPETEIPEELSVSRYGIGIDLRLFKDKFVVTSVEEGSAAAGAGLKTGYILEKINGVSLKEFLEAIRPNYLHIKSFEKKLPAQIIEWFLDGERDTYVEITVLNERDEPQILELRREKIPGEFVTILSNVPEQYLRFDSKNISDEIGYIRFNFFALPVIEKFCAAITDFKDKKALIIDLRGNKGGLVGSIMGITGFLTPKSISLGTEINRRQKEDRVIMPHAKNFKGKIYILIDELSYSAAEMFSAALQENDLATVIGANSAGEALPSLTKVLPTGAVFLFPVANFRTPKGNYLEGNGVKPDLPVALKRENLLRGSDDQYETALRAANEFIAAANAKAKSGNSSKSSPKTPPPPPAAVTGRTPRAVSVKKQQQLKAVRVVDDFIETIGGRDALEQIESYKSEGILELTRAGAVVEGRVEIYWQAPNRYLENYLIEGVGTISDVFDGTDYFVESEFTTTEQVTAPQVLEDKSRAQGFYEILKLRELYPEIIHRGIYTVDERSVHLITAKSATGVETAFAFDTQTKFLVKRTNNFTGDTEFADYAEVAEGIYLPLTIKKGNLFTFRLTGVELNFPVEETRFRKKVSCFDKAD